MVGQSVFMMTSGYRSKFLNLRPPRKLYRIGEVIQYTGLSRQTIHNYTTMDLICESEWTAGGHRLYDESVFEQLALIEQMKRTQTLRQIAAVLSAGVAPGPLGHETGPDGSDTV